MQSYTAASPAQVDRERKRLYLSLLPPPQLIEICLTFDLHAPALARTTVWPLDLEAAIAALQKPAEEQPLPQRRVSNSANSAPEPQDPPKPPTVTEEAPGPPESSNVAAQPTSSGSGPHQLSRFAYPSQPAYPHTPYYPQSSWSSYSQTTYGGSHPYTSPSPSAIHHPPYHHETASADDLPSYEDMIVEALNDDVRDPEGLAPKDLYTWMASHYPVQANFRPSASQALQKAFKRGRFEKSLSGKYRLNPNWKGGNTTRRVTRRPQTHGGAVQPRLAYPNKPAYSNSSYMFGSTHPASATSQGSNSHPPEDDLGDAYEAAQHILKALNFGDGLYKISQDPEDSPNSGLISSEVTNTPSQGAFTSNDISVESIRAELQVQLVLLAAQLSDIASGVESNSAVPDKSSLGSDVPLITLESNVSSTVDVAVPAPVLPTTAAGSVKSGDKVPSPSPLESTAQDNHTTNLITKIPPSPLETARIITHSLPPLLEPPVRGALVKGEPPGLPDVIPMEHIEDSDDEEMDEIAVD
ncbi:hypothetical protein D9757_002075 [Collybiopsis confluens]|uniref:Histone H1 n=1 Tax=Collybiopsis confluens TaxID=2823264 RepID=A0A8H5HXU6_9AGAR|nr:hypothetical protein D9757_002075 [Collybiopsis confluens]